jgi:hypothetical protein
MPRQQPTRLREIEAPRPQDGEIIDARFKIVGRKRRFLSLVWRGLVTIFWAALIGFMIPPAWLAFEYARDFFR